MSSASGDTSSEPPPARFAPGAILFVDVLPAESGETPAEVEARVRLAVEAEAPVKATEHHGSRNSVACVTLAA